MDHIEYNNKFNNFLKNNETIASKSGEVIYIHDIEWRQCYASDDKIRSRYPAYWFVSARGDVISVKRTPKLLNKFNCHDKYVSYFINEASDEDKSIIRAHQLVASVFPEYVDRYGESKARHIHHVGSTYNNSTANLQNLSADIHTLFRRIPRVNVTPEKIQKFMECFSDTMISENVNESMGIVKTKDAEYISTVGELTFSEKAAAQLQQMLTAAAEVTQSDRENKNTH